MREYINEDNYDSILRYPIFTGEMLLQVSRPLEIFPFIPIFFFLLAGGTGVSTGREMSG